ncbi:hypothetical protein [Bacillus sp. B1-b2]|uniref:hypothetical protein n=1 Tax=Bacillus sp. B1-b2 TaxID=2653201 RepID=UPI001D02CC94|nr:hypothetical protein [Bacillus sp. B1-b2]
MNQQKGEKMSNLDSIQDRVRVDELKTKGITVTTNLDSKNVLEDNPYFDPSKTYSKEELEKFKAFFGD